MLRSTIAIPTQGTVDKEIIDLATQAKADIDGTTAAVRGVVPTWHVNFDDGDDDNDGLSSDTPLKTVAAWRNRLGAEAIIKPAGGAGLLSIDSDIPDDDPLYMPRHATGFSILAKCKKTTVATGVIDSLEVLDRAAAGGGQAVTLTATTDSAADFWADKVKLFVEITSGDAIGSRTYISKDLGNREAQIGSLWLVGDPFPNGFVSPGATPSPGDTFKVVTYAEISIGAGPTGGQTTSDQDGVNSVTMMGAKIRRYGNGVVTSLVDCIFPRTSDPGGYDPAQRVEIWDPGFNAIVNCTFERLDGGLRLNPGANVSLASCCLYGSAAFVFNGARLTHDGDSSFMSIPGEFRDSYIQVNGGVVTGGPLSFWDSPFHTIVLINGGKLIFESQSPFLGESGYVQIWGTGSLLGSSGVISFFPDSTMYGEQFVFGGPPVLPSVLMGDIHDGPASGDVIGMDVPDPDHLVSTYAHGFDYFATPPAPTAKRHMKWSNLMETLEDGGFLYDVNEVVIPPSEEDPGGTLTFYSAVARNPGNNAQLVWKSVTFVPNP